MRSRNIDLKVRDLLWVCLAVVLAACGGNSPPSQAARSGTPTPTAATLQPSPAPTVATQVVSKGGITILAASGWTEDPTLEGVQTNGWNYLIALEMGSVSFDVVQVPAFGSPQSAVQADISRNSATQAGGATSICGVPAAAEETVTAEVDLLVFYLVHGGDYYKIIAGGNTSTQQLPETSRDEANMLAGMTCQ